MLPVKEKKKKIKNWDLEISTERSSDINENDNREEGVPRMPKTTAIWEAFMAAILGVKALRRGNERGFRSHY